MQREHLYQVFRVQWRTVLRLYRNVRFFRNCEKNACRLQTFIGCVLCQQNARWEGENCQPYVPNPNAFCSVCLPAAKGECKFPSCLCKSGCLEHSVAVPTLPVGIKLSRFFVHGSALLSYLRFDLLFSIPDAIL